MKNNIVIIAAAIILSLSLIFSAVYLGNSINKSDFDTSDNNNKTSENLLMTAEQAAEYLGVSADTFISKIKRENIEKQNVSSYPTFKFIPYLELDGVRYFSKSELQKWVEYNIYNK